MTWDLFEQLRKRLADGDCEAVIAPLQEMRRHWSEPALATVLADAFMRLGRSDEALAALQADIDEGIDNYWTHYCLGHQLAGLGKLSDAAVAFRRCHAIQGWAASEERGYFITHDYFSGHIRNWQEWFDSRIRIAPIRILEIGSWQGASALWLLDNVIAERAGSITCVDCWEGTREHAFLDQLGFCAEAIFEDNIKASGRAECVIKLKGRSQDLLPGLPAASFDFIYIDGAHEADMVIQDAVNAHRLLARGGYMLFDDIGFCVGDTRRDTSVAIDFFASTFAHEYRQWHRGAQLLLQRRLISDLPRKVLFVLGMHRSGTSALSGLLCHAGFAAPKKLDPAAADNPTGYWEPPAIRAFHDCLLEKAKSSWNDLLVYDDFITQQQLDQQLDDLEAALHRDFPNAASAQGIALIKDPRQCRLQSIWNQWISSYPVEASLLLVVRQPLAVAHSLLQRNQLPVNRSLLLWLSHTLEAEINSRHLNRIVVVYERFLEDPAATVVRCQGHVGLMAHAPDHDSLQNWVRPELNHYCADQHDPADESLGIDGDLLFIANHVYAVMAAMHGERITESAMHELDMAYTQTRQRLQFLAQQSSKLQVVQIFWEAADGAGFSEQNSVRAHVAAGRDFATVDLVLPAAVASAQRLRLDPAEEPCVIELQSIVLVDNRQHPLWRWDASSPPEDAALLPANSRTLFLSKGHLVSASHDPSLFLPIDSSVLAKVTAGSHLLIRARWQEVAQQLADHLVAGMAGADAT
jgi:predicted O-methyltransferase YrrM